MSFSAAAPQVIPAIVLGFVVAAAVAFLVTPFVRRYARRLGVVDRPDPRRVNKRAIARGGGIAIAAGFVPVSIVLLWLNAGGVWQFLEPREIGVREMTALFGGGVLAVAIGALDDIFQLRARWQFLGQLVIASVAVALGVVIGAVNSPFSERGTIQIVGLLTIPVTLFWIVGMVNSINFIDGLDGLSSGIALIAAVTLGLISLNAETFQPIVALLCFTLAGALLGFLRWNFHPASIFAGTSGTMLVGYSLAVLSVLGPAKVAVALLVLGVPIIDTFWIIVRRIASGRPPFAADRGHIHHRLLDLGLSHRNTVLLIYGVCALLSVLAFRLSGTGQLYAFMSLVLVSGVTLFVIARLSGDGVEADLSADSYEPDDAAGPPNALAHANGGMPANAAAQKNDMPPGANGRPSASGASDAPTGSGRP